MKTNKHGIEIDTMIKKKIAVFAKNYLLSFCQPVRARSNESFVCM